MACSSRNSVRKASGSAECKSYTAGRSRLCKSHCTVLGSDASDSIVGAEAYEGCKYWGGGALVHDQSF